MHQKLSKLEAAVRLDVSASTIDRMIQRGQLQAVKEPHGSRHRVWVVLDADVDGASTDSSAHSLGATTDASADVPVDDTPAGSDESSDVEIAVLRERVRNLEELADYHRGLLKDSEWRYQQAMDQLGTSQRTVEALTKALPNADTARNVTSRPFWWPFGKRQR